MVSPSNSHLICRAVDGIGVTLWSGIELDVALICACMPSVYPLFLRAIHHGRPPPARPDPSSSNATIGGSGGKASRFKKRSLWSDPSMTGLTATNSHEEYKSTRDTSGEYMELDERSTP